MKENINISSPEFQNALSLIKFTHQSVFLTGKAGTGKSTFLRYIRTEVKKKSVVLAPTGIAAINAEGSTLHSFFKLPFYPLLLDDPKFSVRRIRDFLKYKKSQIKLLKQVDLIIIDEISMVRADIIDFIDRILRVYCQNMREPFGGKQMLLIGDVFQLEPVVKSDEREILSKFYPNPYFFSAHVFQQMKLVSIELKKVFRQKDAGFIAALDHIRQNKITDLELKLLNSRYAEEGEIVKQKSEGLNIVLATRRDNVDFINQTELDKLPGNTVLMKGVVTGDFPESSLPTLLQLELKENAQIIFIKNDPDHRWVNGTLGTISSFNPENGSIEVITEDGEIVNVSEERWSNVRYTYNEKEKKIEEEELGTFTQYPIRLAWAITIHKSQGLTFQNVTIDFSGGTFAGGQAYVALSRCTSLNGITLKKRITRSDIFVRPEIIEFAARFNDQQDLQRALMEAKADTEYQACAKAFDKGDMAACLEHFFIAIHTRYDIEKPTVKRLIRKKLNVFKRLQQQRDEMKLQLEAQDERLKKYATEYYMMGNECLTQAHAPKAAIANYSKALELYPNYVDALVRRGVTYLDEKQLNEALHDLNQAVQLSPRSFKANYNRGKVFMAKGVYEEAANDFIKATSLNTEHAQSHKLAGDAFAALGKEDTAAMYWELAEQLRDKKKRR